MTSATPKPRAGEHTKEPWKIGYSDGSGMGEDGESAYILDAEENPVIWGGKDDWGCAKGARDMATARRIVACVNACEGYPTDFLESGEFRSWIKGGAQAEEALRERERELVEALASLIDGYSKWTTRQSNAGEWLETQAKAKALLAKHGR